LEKGEEDLYLQQSNMKASEFFQSADNKNAFGKYMVESTHQAAILTVIHIVSGLLRSSGI
jgi:hypothetical protein